MLQFSVIVEHIKNKLSLMPILKCEQKLLISSFLGRNYRSSCRVTNEVSPMSTGIHRLDLKCTADSQIILPYLFAFR